jgi:hypothetical protein
MTDVLASTGLGARADQLAGTLSGGWKQRVALACATLHEPPLLFLDEPTAGVDPVSRRDFWEQIHQLAPRGHHGARDHALHGRGRALPPPRVHLPRRAARRGDPRGRRRPPRLRVCELRVDDGVPRRAAARRARVEEVAHYGRCCAWPPAAATPRPSARGVSAPRGRGERSARRGPRWRTRSCRWCATTRAGASVRPGRLLAVARKELLQLRRDRLTLAMMVDAARRAAPALRLRDQHRRAPRAHGGARRGPHRRSRDFVRRLEATGFDRVVGGVRDHDELARALRGAPRAWGWCSPRATPRARAGRDRARAARRRRLRPADRGERHQHRRGPRRRAGAQLSRRSASRAGARPARRPGEPRGHTWYNPDLRTAVFVVPGLVGRHPHDDHGDAHRHGHRPRARARDLEQLIVSPVRRSSSWWARSSPTSSSGTCR